MVTRRPRDLAGPAPGVDGPVRLASDVSLDHAQPGVGQCGLGRVLGCPDKARNCNLLCHGAPHSGAATVLHRSLASRGGRRWRGVSSCCSRNGPQTAERARVSTGPERCDDASLTEAEHCETPCPTPSSRGGRAPVGRPRTARPFWILGAVLLAMRRWRCACAGARRIGPFQPPRQPRQRHDGDGVHLQRRLQLVEPGAERDRSVGRVREHHGPARPRERQHARRDVGGTSTLPVGTLPVTFHASISASPQPEPLVGPTVTVDVAPTHSDARTHPAADADAHASTDRCTDANPSARPRRAQRRRRPEAPRVPLPPVRSRHHRPRE